MKKLLLFLSLPLAFFGCVDRTFDEPPVKELVIPFQANASIDQIKQFYVAGKVTDINQDLYIIGTIIADDKSGNFYKQIIVQDSTGGVVIKIDRIGLYAKFPQGSKVGIKCKGLSISDYGGLIQIGKGSAVVNGKTQLAFIPDSEAEGFVFPGARNQVVVPKVVSINSLKSSDLSTLVQLDQVEFDRADVGKTIATPGGGSFIDLNLTDCNKAKILLHTSDFADFAAYRTPSFNGTIVAVLGKFNSNIQLYLRDTSEIKFTQAPCNGGGGTAELATISTIRKLYNGTTTTVDKNYYIRGVVISDKMAGNVNAQNLVLQDATGGITLRFTATHSFSLGAEIEVNVFNQELSEFRGLLQVNNLPVSNATLSSTGLSVTHKVININEINTNFDQYESTLVRINGVNLTKSGDATYASNVLATDNSGSINLFTNTKASFAGDNFPVAVCDLIVIVSEFDTKQILLRNLNDVITIASNPELRPLSDVRKIYKDSITKISVDYYVRATVISDRSASNVPAANMVIQDGSAGITVRFTTTHTYNLGDQVEINVRGLELSTFNGLLQLNNVPAAAAHFISSGNTITPKVLTAAEIVGNLSQYEGQLVLIQNASITKSAGNTYSSACIVTDASGTIELFTRTQASFASAVIPTTAVNITAIVTQFNKPQIMIRNTDDVKP